MSKPEPEMEGKQPGLPEVDVNEYGGKRDGVRQAMNRRLFMQLLVFDVPGGTVAATRSRGRRPTTSASGRSAASSTPTRWTRAASGLLTWSEDPAHFVRAVRPLFATEPSRASRCGRATR